MKRIGGAITDHEKKDIVFMPRCGDTLYSSNIFVPSYPERISSK